MPEEKSSGKELFLFSVGEGAKPPKEEPAKAEQEEKETKGPAKAKEEKKVAEESTKKAQVAVKAEEKTDTSEKDVRNGAICCIIIIIIVVLLWLYSIYDAAIEEMLDDFFYALGL